MNVAEMGPQARAVYADWLEKRGEVDQAATVREEAFRDLALAAECVALTDEECVFTLDNAPNRKGYAARLAEQWLRTPGIVVFIYAGAAPTQRGFRFCDRGRILYYRKSSGKWGRSAQARRVEIDADVYPHPDCQRAQGDRLDRRSLPERP